MKLTEAFLKIVDDMHTFLETKDNLLKEKLIDELDKSFSFVSNLDENKEIPFTVEYINFVALQDEDNLISLLETDEPCLEGVPNDLVVWEKRNLSKLLLMYKNWKNRIAQGQLRSYFIVAFGKTGLLASLRMNSYDPLPHERIQGITYDQSVARSLDDARKVIKYYWLSKFGLDSNNVDRSMKKWAIEWDSSLLSEFESCPITGESFTFPFTILFFLSSLRILVENGHLCVFSRKERIKIEHNKLVLPSNIIASGCFQREDIPDESFIHKKYQTITCGKVTGIESKMHAICEVNKLWSKFGEKEKLVDYFFIPHENHNEIGISEEITLISVENLDELLHKFFPDWDIRCKEDSNTEKIDSDLNLFLKQALSLVQDLKKIHQEGTIYKYITLETIVQVAGGTKVKLVDPTIANSIAISNPKKVLPYISPEQSGYYLEEVDYRTDFYSLGIVLYQLLTKKHPFSFKNTQEIIDAHIIKEIKPPHTLSPEIPKSISLVIMKLLFKNPDERYKDAISIEKDLIKCVEYFTKGIIDDFCIGEGDICERFLYPHKLYGREMEIAELKRAWERFICGDKELVMLHGMPGVGKTFLVYELLPDILKKNGLFFMGKYTSNNENSSYAAFIQVFQMFCEYLMLQEPEKRDKWREKIIDKLKTNVQIIIDVVPELEQIVGKQEPLPLLPLEESRNRFYFAFEQFFEVLVDEKNPFILFLDDIQWIDTASLNLIARIISKLPPKKLMLIVSLRDNEKSSLDIEKKLVNSFHDENTPTNKIFVENLSLEAIEALLSYSFLPSQKNIRELAQVIFEKTIGNPFFVKQFLLGIYKQRYIYFDSSLRLWNWNLESIIKEGVGLSIFEMLQKKILSLDLAVQKLVKGCSILKNPFHVNIAAYILKESPDYAQNVINKAIDEKILIVNSSELFSKEKITSYQFVHDIMQSAIYRILSREELMELNLSIGKYFLLLGKQEENILDIVRHLNRGNVGGEELLNLLHLNFEAAVKTKISAGYEEAREYIYYIIENMEKFSMDNDFKVKIYQEQGEIEYLCGNLDKAEKVFLKIVSVFNDKKFVCKTYICLVGLYTHLGLWDKSFKVAKDCLAVLNIKLPEKEVFLSVIFEAVLIKLFLLKIGKKTSYFKNLKEMNDEDKKIELELLTILLNTTYYKGKLYSFWNTLKMMRITLQSGISLHASSAYAYFAMLMGHLKILGDYSSGRDFIEIASEIAHKYKNPLYVGRTTFTCGVVVNHWTEDVRLNIEYLKKAKEYCLQSGDIVFASFSTGHHMPVLLFTGMHLQRLWEQSEVVSSFLESVKFTPQKFFPLGIQDFISHFIDLPNNTNLKEIDTEEYIKQNVEIKNITGIAWLNILKLKRLFLFGFYDEALTTAQDTKKYIEGAFGQIMEVEYYFYYTLSLCACYAKSNFLKRYFYKMTIKRYIKKMKVWQNNCEANFRHKYLILEAEWARVRKKELKAMQLYEKAIRKSIEGKYIQKQGLANELAANFYLSIQVTSVAEIYFKSAIGCYQNWGAIKKVRQLQNVLKALN